MMTMMATTTLLNDGEQVATISKNTLAATCPTPYDPTTTLPPNKQRLDFNLLQRSGGNVRQDKILQALLKYVHCTDSTQTAVNHQQQQQQQPKPTVWIEAEAGVGKSFLLQQFTEQCRQCNSKKFSVSASASAVMIVKGKFEERASASEPFAALSETVNDLVMQVRQQERGDSISKHTFGLGLKEELDSEWALLVSILPVLKLLLPDGADAEDREDVARGGISHGDMESEEESKETHQSYEDEDAFGNFNTKEYRFERFRLAFRTLIRYTCDQLRKAATTTLVMLLDDLHWVDPDSLQIIKTLIEDPKKPTNFLLLCATRPIDGFPYLHNLYRKQQHGDSYVRSTQKRGGSNNSSSVFENASSLTFKATTNTKLRIIGVPRLSVVEIHDIISLLLGRTNSEKRRDMHDKHGINDGDEDIMELASIVKSKTQGNSFVVIQFLRLLERLGHIYYDETKGRWSFDITQVILVDDCCISENVSQVVAHSLESGTSKRRKSALMVAASFGVSQFDVSTIVHAVTVLEKQELQEEADDDHEHGEQVQVPIQEDHDDEYEDPFVIRKRVDEMSFELTEAALDGYVEETSPGHYRFAHDRIRESAYSLLPEGNSRKEVHLRVGRQLRSWMDTQAELGIGEASGFSKDSLLLHATKQLNIGSDLIEDDWELLELADMNYQAAELAARKTAFFSSMEYLQVGLSLLGGGGKAGIFLDDQSDVSYSEKDKESNDVTERAWTRHYNRALQFSVALTRMQFCCGLLNECWVTSSNVIKYAKTFLDNSPIYHTPTEHLMGHDDASEWVQT